MKKVHQFSDTLKLYRYKTKMKPLSQFYAFQKLEKWNELEKQKAAKSAKKEFSQQKSFLLITHFLNRGDEEI